MLGLVWWKKSLIGDFTKYFAKDQIVFPYQDQLVGIFNIYQMIKHDYKNANMLIGMLILFRFTK